MPPKRKSNETCDPKQDTKSKSEIYPACDWCEKVADIEGGIAYNGCDMCHAVYVTHTACVTKAFVKCAGDKCAKVLCHEMDNKGGCAETLHDWKFCHNCSMCCCTECYDVYLFQCERCGQCWCGECSEGNNCPECGSDSEEDDPEDEKNSADEEDDGDPADEKKSADEEEDGDPEDEKKSADEVQTREIVTRLMKFLPLQNCVSCGEINMLKKLTKHPNCECAASCFICSICTSKNSTNCPMKEAEYRETK